MHTCRCVYLPGSGALFVGYVIVVAFISSPLDLIRVPELIVYVYRRLTAVTRLEKEKALSKVRQDCQIYRWPGWQYGMHTCNGGGLRECFPWENRN